MFLGRQSVLVLQLEPAEKLASFEKVMLPHLSAAYNLARWLSRSGQDAEDVVQEAYLRAFRFFDGFHGGDGRAWLLTIVRNVYYSLVGRSPARELTTVFDEEMHSSPRDDFTPELRVLRRAESRQLQEAIEELPRESREVLVLRELEDLSYKQIAEIVEIPIGTVMSRLARARSALKLRLEHWRCQPGQRGALSELQGHARPHPWLRRRQTGPAAKSPDRASSERVL